MYGEGSPGGALRAEIGAQLDRLLALPSFASSARRVQLLRYMVDRALAGDDAVNEYAIGVDVFVGFA